MGAPSVRIIFVLGLKVSVSLQAHTYLLTILTSCCLWAKGGIATAANIIFGTQQQLFLWGKTATICGCYNWWLAGWLAGRLVSLPACLLCRFENYYLWKDFLIKIHTMCKQHKNEPNAVVRVGTHLLHMCTCPSHSLYFAPVRDAVVNEASPEWGDSFICTA